MTNNTKSDVFFFELLDSLTKKIYNKNIIGFLFIFVLLQCFSIGTGADKSARAYEGQEFDVRLECFSVDGAVELEIFFPDDVGFCGLYGEIAFDPSLSLIEVGATGEFNGGGVLTWGSAEDRAVFLVDYPNAVVGAPSLKMKFGFIGDPKKLKEFVLINAEAYTWENGELCSLSVPSVSILPYQKDKRSEIVKCEFSDGNLVLVGNACEGSFAAGVDVAIVDLYSASLSRFFVVAALPISEQSLEFERVLEMPVGRFCVILCPISYSRSGAERGTETSWIIIDGTAVGVQDNRTE